MLIDTHFHLDDFEKDGSAPEVIQRAVDAGVSRMVAIGGSDFSNDLAIRVAGEHTGVIYASAGYDRDLAKDWDGDCSRVLRCLENPLVVATGESGLDYHYEPETAPEQKHLFEAMLDCAANAGKPIVVHSRDADEDMRAMLSDYVGKWKHADRSPGVLHCFTGGMEFAKRLVELGFLISFSGILSFRNAQSLRDVAAALPLDSIVIETDAPYLAPVPMRGKRNEPGFVAHVADCLAEVRGISAHEIAEATSRNAHNLFDFQA